MEHSQLSQVVTWLDKEHQRDRVELNQLQQRVETLTEEREEQAKRITDLEAELVALRAQIDRATRAESYLEPFQREMNALLEKSEAQRKRALRDSDRARQIEIDNITQTINEFRKEIDRLRRYDEELAAHRAETQRLTETAARLQQQLLDMNKSQDERVRSVAYLEEQRHQDNKRLAQLQAQATELFKKNELQLSRIQQLEQLASRVSELKSNIEEMRQQQTKELERAQFQDAQRERHMKNWLQEAETQRQRMEEYGQQMERYAEQYHRARKAIEELQEFEDHLQRQQHETAELQRLAENRQKSQFEEWQAQEEQRWKKHTMEWDHQWSEYDKAMADLTERITVLEKRSQDNERLLQLLLQMAEEDAQMRVMIARDWQSRFEEMVDQE